MNLRTVVDSILAKSPARDFVTRSTADQLRVLAYHRIESPDNFERQIDYVAREMRPVDLDTVLQAARGAADLPPRSVLVTFDDAGRTLLDGGLPVLRRHRVPAVAFVVSGHLNTQRPYWWEEVEDLLEAGASAPRLDGDSDAAVRQLKELPDATRRRTLRQLRKSARSPVATATQLTHAEVAFLSEHEVEIGNHTVTHPILTRCSSRRVRSEISKAHAALTRITGCSPRAFAYPNGDCSPEAMKVLGELGYEAGFLHDHRLSDIPPEDPLRISRVRVSADATMDRFRMIVSGLHPRLHHAVGRR